MCWRIPVKLECPQCRWKIVWRQEECVMFGPYVAECPMCMTRVRQAVPTLSEILNPVYRLRARYWQLRNLGRLVRACAGSFSRVDTVHADVPCPGVRGKGAANST
jgi:hypothetical protein